MTNAKAAGSILAAAARMILFNMETLLNRTARVQFILLIIPYSPQQEKFIAKSIDNL
jgi:hypothetical protein